MKMRQTTKCFLGLHEMEILEKEEYSVNAVSNDRVIRVVYIYVLRCKHCGKIKFKTIKIDGER